uniref:Uncharacterized protein n=1 Tax=Lactuca sativa TaxID=4236 RepID=A0A9R1V6N4_LACSA|nr:hypothetical protein LSAT_V11C600329730 [Lactuca sativa]
MSIPNNKNNLLPLPPLLTKNSRFFILLVLNREKLNNKEYVLDKDVPTIRLNPIPDEVVAYNNHHDKSNKVKNFENSGAFVINQQLEEMFQEQARQE